MTIYEAYHAQDEFVQLTEWEMLGAMFVAKKMREESLKDNRIEYVGGKVGGADGLHIQYIGALVERGVAKALDVYWEGHINVFKQPDLSHEIEVRLIGVDHYGLRVRDSDLDSRRIVGCVMLKGEEDKPYRLPGWIYAGEAKRSDWSMNPYDGRPMYCVPQKELRPLNELRRLILEEKQEALNL